MAHMSSATARGISISHRAISLAEELGDGMTPANLSGSHEASLGLPTIAHVNRETVASVSPG